MPPPAIPSSLTSTGAPPSAVPLEHSDGWTVTVYYTAVERFHEGQRLRVTGCSTMDCVHGKSDLGNYPRSFVDAVRDEGTGLTNRGTYLNWSSDTGFWLDSAPRDSAGGALRPFESAAADPDVLPRGARFALAACGHEEDGSPVDPRVCQLLRAGRWVVSDEFTPGLGGPRHVDLYLGEETGPGFTDSVWYATLTAATLTIGPRP